MIIVFLKRICKFSICDNFLSDVCNVNNEK